MVRQLEVLNGVALLITALSLALMSVLALPAAASLESCAGPLYAPAPLAHCASLRR